MIYAGPLVDAIAGIESQHFDLRGSRAFTDLLFPPVGINTFDQSARGDIIRARLTIKTHGPLFSIFQ